MKRTTTIVFAVVAALWISGSFFCPSTFEGITQVPPLQAPLPARLGSPLHWNSSQQQEGIPKPSARKPRWCDEMPQGISSATLSSLRQEYEKHRYDAFPVEGGHRANNPGQHWQTTFDGRGFTTRPQAGGWEWGLELVSYGFSGRESIVTGKARVSVEGQRVTYDRDDTLQEWFVNDRRGLEHGFTLKRRPNSGRQVTRASTATKQEMEPGLTFALAIRGPVRPVVEADGLGMSFVAADGATLVTYAGLTVRDAGGQTLPARFQMEADGLRLGITEANAQYPLTIDPIAQQAYLKASNTDSNDNFGISAAVSGDTVVVGASGESSNATGVNGNQSDNSAKNSGAVYVFVRNGTNWSQQAYLKASNAESNDNFGVSVALSRDTLVVGASGESSNATGVNGNQSNNSAKNSGAAYVFVRNGTNWSQQAYLKASNAQSDDAFGISVAVSEDTVVIGAPAESSIATGVNGDQSNNLAPNSGAVYVFVRNGGIWTQQAYLKASNSESGDRFGLSVAASGATVVAGAFFEDSDATGVNGNQTDNHASNSGAAYVFVRSGTNWSQQAYLKASNTDPGDTFGYSLAVSEDTVVVGAPTESSNATGVNGNQRDNSGVNSGAVYVFVRNGLTWTQQAYLKASNSEPSDTFGYSVTVSGDTIVVGALTEASNATGINGNQSDNSAVNAGSAYVFVRVGTNWSQQVYLKASNAYPGGRFGSSVALAGGTAVVSAFGDPNGAAGVNSDVSGNQSPNAGGAYIFTALGLGPRLLAVSDGSGGYFVRFQGMAEFRYDLQRSVIIEGPWFTIRGFTNSNSGLIEYHDNSPAGKAFYRTVHP